MFKRDSYIYYALGNGMFYFSWAMFACIISVYLADNQCSATEISLITSASALFAMATQPICGFFADKYHSPRKVAIVTAFLAIISGIAFSYSKSFILLFLFNGFTQGFLNGITSLTDRLATASSYGYGSIRLWGSMLYAVGAQVSGLIYDHISPKANYIVFVIGALIVIFNFYMMNENTTTKEKSVKQEKITTKEVVLALLKNKAFLFFMIIYFLYQGAATAQGIYFPLFMKELGASTTMVGTAILLFGLFEIPVFYFSDRVIKKIPYKYLMIFACLLALVRYSWYSLCPNPNMIIYMLFFQGLTNTIFIIVSVKVILVLVDEKYVNTAYGISAMLARGVAALIYQIVVGNIIDVFPGIQGYIFSYYIFAATMIICTLLCFKLKNDKINT